MLGHAVKHGLAFDIGHATIFAVLEIIEQRRELSAVQERGRAQNKAEGPRKTERLSWPQEHEVCLSTFDCRLSTGLSDYTFARRAFPFRGATVWDSHSVIIDCGAAYIARPRAPLDRQVAEKLLGTCHSERSENLALKKWRYEIPRRLRPLGMTVATSLAPT